LKNKCVKLAEWMLPASYCSHSCWHYPVSIRLAM